MIGPEVRFSQIRDIDIANGDGCRVSVWLCGCDFHCPGCFNEAEQDYGHGEVFGLYDFIHVIEALKPPYIKGLTILGGEPLNERNSGLTFHLAEATQYIYEGTKDVWVFTGNTLEEVRERYPEVLENIDVLVDGRFEADKVDTSGSFRGSTNQRIWRKAGKRWISDRL